MGSEMCIRDRAEYPAHMLFTQKEKQKAEKLTEALFKNHQAVELLRDSTFEVGAVDDTIEDTPLEQRQIS